MSIRVCLHALGATQTDRRNTISVYIVKVLFELGLWSYSELKWLEWSVSNDPALCVCVCVCEHTYDREAERKPRKISQTVLLYNCRQINTWPQHWQENPIRGQTAGGLASTLTVNTHVYTEMYGNPLWCHVSSSPLSEQTLYYSRKYLWLSSGEEILGAKGVVWIIRYMCK